MSYGLKIAWRYLTANRAQTVLLVLGVAVGVFVFVFMSALIGGLAVFLIDRTVGSVAHISIAPSERKQPSTICRSSFTVGNPRPNTGQK